MTNPRELVERLEAEAKARDARADFLFNKCTDDPYSEQEADYNRDRAALCREAASEITRLRDFITALEDGNMTFLCDQLDRAKEENTRLREERDSFAVTVVNLAQQRDRLRGLLEEALSVIAKLVDGEVRPVAEILSRAEGWNPDDIYSIDGGPLLKGWEQFVPAASSLLKRLEGE